MIVWNRCVLVLGLWIVWTNPPARGQGSHPLSPAPARLGMDPSQVISGSPGITFNQKVANTIAGYLRQSGTLRQYQVDIAYQNGVAELVGQVADAAQRDEVMRIVQSVPGVEVVRDHLVLTSARAVKPVQGVLELPRIEQGPPPNKEAEGPPEPAPIFQAQPGALPDPATNPPRMPPYAWPTYAPYNNYSRVASPTLYPYNAWPFIGPFYPFPKVPMGWRSIHLKWSDGYWWYGRHASGHDWWRIRYR